MLDSTSNYCNFKILLEYWQSQEGPHRALFKFAGAMFKLYKSRSKFTVKVTCLKSMVPLERYGDKEYVKYKHPVSYTKKVKANVQK